MATGIAPPDPSTPVGSLRYVIGDYEYVALSPAVAGYGNYAAFSDAELEALLTMSEDNQSRAVGYAYLKLAGKSAAQAIAWASDDLRLNLEKVPSELRAIAKMWFEQADEEDISGGSAEYFDLVPLRVRNAQSDELAEWPSPFGWY
jgi:hypothetical protein